jgi:hypothetical protein
MPHVGHRELDRHSEPSSFMARPLYRPWADISSPHCMPMKSEADRLRSDAAGTVEHTQHIRIAFDAPDQLIEHLPLVAYRRCPIVVIQVIVVSQVVVELPGSVIEFHLRSS